MLGGERDHRVGVARSQRADEHALDAAGERRLDLRGRAEAATDLQTRPAPAGESLEHRRVLGAALAVARGIEVDHVQPPGAGQREAMRRPRPGVSSKPVTRP